MSRLANRHSRGFTILELMIGMAIFLVLSGAILGAMANLQKSYRSREMRTTMQQRIRATMELMAQEIGQAGLQGSTLEGDDEETPTNGRYHLTQDITSAMIGVDQSVRVSSITGMYAGQWLQVPGGLGSDGVTPCLQDAIQISASPSGLVFNAKFGCSHLANTQIYPMGVFPHGILVGSPGDPSTPGDATHPSKLAFFGDINGSANGSFAVEYACPSTFPGSLTRTEWTLPTLTSTSYPLIDNVTACSFCWPGAAGCPAGTPNTATLNDPLGTVTYQMITQVGFTITVSEIDPTSGTNQTISITKSYSNIQPRNIIAADSIYTAACTTALGATPPGLCKDYLHGELQPDPPQIANITW